MGGSGAQPYIPASNYIQDGLIFQLDGIEYGDIAGHWIDLKQNGDFTIPDSGVTKTTYGFIFDSPTTGNTTSAIMDGDISSMPYANLNTVEFVFRDLDAVLYSQEVSIFNTKAGTNAGPFLRYQNWGTFFTGKYRYQMMNIPNVLMGTISIPSDETGSNNQNYGFCNGQKITLLRQTSGYGAGSYVMIGSIKKASLCICAIRLYNKRLSDSEILYNQKIDNTRFNLGLSI